MARTQVTGTQILDASVVLGTDTSGTLLVANGGTGSTTLTNAAVLTGAGTGAIGAIAPGAVGTVLASNGTVWAAATPASQSLAVTNAANDFGANTITNYNANITSQAGTAYTLVQADNATIIRTTSATAVTISLPNSFSAGYSVMVMQDGAGQVTFAAATGATLTQRQSLLNTAAQNAVVTLFVKANAGAAAAWVLTGDVA